MKFRLYATLIGLMAAAFAACNNGNYDAQPSVDGSSTQNPINPTLTAAKGTLKVRIDGQLYTFDTCRFVLEDSIMRIGALQVTPDEPTRIVNFGFFPYRGVKTYPLLDTGGTAYSAGGAYVLIYGTDTVGMNIYNTAWSVKKGFGEVKVDLSSPGEVRGTFNFTAFRQAPASADDKVVMTDGSFWATPE